MPTLTERNKSYELWDWRDDHVALTKMEPRELEGIRTVLRDLDIAVSYTSGSDFDGVRLSCFRVTSKEPVLDGNWREPLYGDGKWFPNRVEAQRFCLIAGYLVEFRSLR